MSSRRRVSIWATVAAIALAACGGGSTADEAAAPVTAATAPAAESDASDSATTEAVFVPLADGGQLDFNSLRGQDVMFWFWAPW